MHAACTHAQLTATVSAVSDYRFRGVSLSQQKPAGQVNIGYDDASGWYAGLFGSTVELTGSSPTIGQVVPYLGVAKSVGGGFHWDTGADYSAFSDGSGYDYGEVYTGIASRGFNVRVHYSPNYFGLARGSFYGEMNGSHRLADGLVLLGHSGVLVPANRGDDQYTQYPPSARDPVDVRAGLGFEVAGFKMQLAWVWTNGIGSLYPVSGGQRRSTVVASVSWSP